MAVLKQLSEFFLMENQSEQYFITHEEVEKRIIKIRSEDVILDSDVAMLYGVETRAINKAVRNNPDKFPEGYVIALTHDEKQEVVEILHHLHFLKYSPVLPKAFTEKGLYMLATILKSKKATATTLSIIETFSKTKEIARTIKQIPTFKENSPQYQNTVRKAGEMIADLIVSPLNTDESEASIEFNLALVKFKYRIHKKKQ